VTGCGTAAREARENSSPATPEIPAEIPNENPAFRVAASVIRAADETAALPAECTVNVACLIKIKGEGEEIARAEAVPVHGWEFVAWDDGNTDAVRDLTMDGDKELTARFQRKTFTLNVRGQHIACPSVQTAKFGESLQISTMTRVLVRSHTYQEGIWPVRAYRVDGYDEFVNWIGANILNPSNPSTAVLMNGNQNAQAFYRYCQTETRIE
jgi:hypothetical protein